MKIAIDGYCYHRYFGEVYPNLETAPDANMTLDDLKRHVDYAAAVGARIMRICAGGTAHARSRGRNTRHY